LPFPFVPSQKGGQAGPGGSAWIETDAVDMMEKASATRRRSFFMSSVSTFPERIRTLNIIFSVFRKRPSADLGFCGVTIES
jgi:hypothetical protein